MGRKKAENQGISSGSDDISARRRLLDAATRLFCRYGINAVGVDAIVKEADTAKATLYKNFRSKEGLVAAVLEHEGQHWRDWFLGAMLKGEASAQQKLHRIFPLLEEWFGQERFFGCPFINALAEHDKQEATYRQIALAHKKLVLDALADLAQQAGASNPQALAHDLGLLMDGAIVVAMMTNDPHAAQVASRMADIVLAPLGGKKSI